MRVRTLSMMSIAMMAIVATAPRSAARQPTLGWGTSGDVRPVITMGLSSGYHPSRGTTRATASIPLEQGRFVGMKAERIGGRHGLCQGGLTFSFPSAGEVASNANWQVEARLVGLHDDTATIDVRWHRLAVPTGFVPDAPLALERRLVMQDGDRVDLDSVRSSESMEQGCDMIAMDIAFDLRGPDHLADAAISYDIWLVQSEPDGEVTTERFESTGKQDEQVRYFFRPRRYDTDGSRASDAADRDTVVTTQLSGAVRGRLRGDGLIDLSIDEARFVGDRGGGKSANGRKRLAVQQGETVEFEVPVDPSLRQSANGKEDLSVVVDRLKTAIRVTARRVW
jgi:hypothetical protein